jgi:glutamine synthetase
MSEKTLNLIKQHEARWIDLRFTDTKGKEQHVTYPSNVVDDKFFVEGKMFDGSSIGGWKGINESDMILMPDDSSAVLDPFYDEPTIIVRCDIVEPSTMQGYDRDPRSIGKRAEEYLKSTGLGDKALFGPEPEFFIFDSVHYSSTMGGAFYKIKSEEAAWSSGEETEGKTGHAPRVKGGYFPVAPIDSLHDIRAAMCNAMEAMGLEIEVHHHEVANAGQCEIGVGANTLVKKADEVQILKYCIHNVAHQYGKTATFMPKPLIGDNGSGMHVHQSYSLNGVNQFAGEAYAGLSETALFYIGGIIKHAKSLNAFCNASTNSYKRLVPGFEAPVMLAYSARNRSASIRIPFVAGAKAKRIETRFPDPTANPYLCFAALLMAGLDGVKNKIHPGEPATKDLYDLEPEEEKLIPTVCASLEEALSSLEADHEYLLQGGVFSKDFIESYIELKKQDIQRVNMTPHPVEFELYYSV